MEFILWVVLVIIVVWCQFLFYCFNELKGEAIAFYTEYFSSRRYFIIAYDVLDQIWGLVFAVVLLSFLVIFKRIEFRFAIISYVIIQLFIILMSRLVGGYIRNRVSLERKKRIFYLNLWLNLILLIFCVPVWYLGGKEARISAVEVGTNVDKGDEVLGREKGSDAIKVIDWEGMIVKEIMVPRVDIIAIRSDAKLDELYELFMETKYSRIPVYEKDIDSIIGVVTLKDFVANWDEESKSDLVTKILKPVIYVPETKKVATMLKQFKESKTSMAIVLNEYGGTAGLVTIHDIMENIVGEIKDEYDEEQEDQIVKVEGGYILNGKTDISTVQELLGVKIEEGDYETISGYILSFLGRVPSIGEKIKANDLLIEIVSSDRRKINRVKVIKLQ